MSTAAMSSFLMMLALSGGAPLPLGVPPTEQDPLLAQAAPHECLFFTTWGGVVDPDPNSQNQTERLLADPEVQHALKTIDSQITGLFHQEDGALSGPWGDAYEWGKLVLASPGTAYVSSAAVDGESLLVQGAIILRIGEQVEKLKKVLEGFQTAFLGDRVTTVEIGGNEYYQFQSPPIPSQITWGTRSEYLIVGFGAKSIETLFSDIDRNRRDGLPAWLTKAREGSDIQRLSTLTYANVGKIKPLVARLTSGNEELRRWIDILGVLDVSSYGMVTGLDQGGYVSHSFTKIDGPATGLLKLVKGAPLTRDELKPIPKDALVAICARLDNDQVVDAMLDVADEIEKGAGDAARQGMGIFAEETGIDLRKDFLGSLGDVWTVYATPSDGSLLTGWTASARVRDYEKLQQIDKNLRELLAKALEEESSELSVGRAKFGEFDIYYAFSVHGVSPVLPSWCVTKDELILALFPQAIKAHLRQRERAESLADVPEVAAAFADQPGPVIFTYADSRRLFQLAYPGIQVGLQLLLNQARAEGGFEFDMALLPSSSAIEPHLRPQVASIRRTKDGIAATTKQTLPGGNLVTSAPGLLGILLPAAQQARLASRREQSKNNLRQIGLALHNFNDTYRHLPTAYNTDKEGKPLLSWRVRMLPYIERQLLYDRFHHDEPWDSEHNLKLLEEMPPVFRSPNSQAGANMTTIHAIGGEGGCFRAPTEDTPFYAPAGRFHGITFGEITDGLANTIWVVEGADETAVEWTKPTEFVPNDMNPLKGFVGQYKSGFHALMGDGASYFFPETIDRELLKRLLHCRDGKPVGDFRPR